MENVKFKNQLALIFVLFCQIASCQEVFTFDYSFGHLNLSGEEASQFLKSIKKIDVENVDSILFVSQSDSVGTFLSNFRTNELRSKRLKKKLQTNLKSTFPYCIYPTSGEWEKEKGSTRKVQVIVYTSEFVKPKKEENAIPTGCFMVAYSELQTYQVSTISKGKKSITKLQRMPLKSSSKVPELFSGSLDKNSQFVVMPLIWKREKTGKSWWAMEREFVEIPTEDFDRFKIFYIQKEPCSQCHENFQINKAIENKEMNFSTDHFLMNQLQFKTSVLNKNKVSVRVPKDFIDTDLDYFTLNNQKINWIDKEKDFYHARIAQTNGELIPIQRKFAMHVDSNCRFLTKNQEEKKTIVGPQLQKFMAYNFAEFGLHGQTGTNYTYAALGLFAGTKIMDLEFLIGLHAKSAIFGSIRARYTIVSIPFNTIFSGNKWKKSLESNRFWYSKLYVGAEYKGSIGKHSDNYLEPNLHSGITISKNYGSVFHRIFIQYGKGVNFMEKSPRLSYNILQVGFQLQLGKKTYQSERGN